MEHRPIHHIFSVQWLLEIALWRYLVSERLAGAQESWLNTQVNPIPDWVPAGNFDKVALASVGPMLAHVNVWARIYLAMATVPYRAYIQQDAVAKLIQLSFLRIVIGIWTIPQKDYIWGTIVWMKLNDATCSFDAFWASLSTFNYFLAVSNPSCSAKQCLLSFKHNFYSLFQLMAAWSHVLHYPIISLHAPFIFQMPPSFPLDIL